jgi:hypothetical protein
MFRTATAAVLLLVLSGVPAHAADVPNGAEASSSSTVATAVIHVPTLTSTVATPAHGGNPYWAPFSDDARFHQPAHLSTERPAVLPALYAGLAALNIYDGYSTRHGLAMGAQEGNGLMAGVAHHSGAFWTVKAAATALPILIAERSWRTHRTRAIVMMVITNAVMGAVAYHNAQALHQLR